MEQELDQLVQAIMIASDPLSGPSHHQALEYLSAFQQNSGTTWRLSLALFVEMGSDGTRKYPPQARFFALRVLDDFLDNRFEPLDDDSFNALQQSLISYIQSEYLYGPAESSATFIRNKFSHTLTLFFLCTYLEQWPTFFGDLFTLIRPSESTSQATSNPHLSLLFFRILLEISGEVADQLIKSARTFTAVRHSRDGRVRDTVRERDASAINDAVLAIVAEGVANMTRLRKSEPQVISERDLDSATEIVDVGVRAFASYVGWIDINLTVTPTTIPLLFSLLSDSALTIRLATCVAITKIVTKGLKEPSDKIQLFKVLSLGPVLDALETRTRAEQAGRGSDVDEGEESYREALGKLLNAFGLELTKLLEEHPTGSFRDEATQMLNELLPIMLRFMADEYDDTCSTIFPLLQTVLSNYKRARKSSPEPLDETKRTFLQSLLRVILQKLKWDEEVDPEDMDEDDKMAFEELRKDLRTFMDSALFIDHASVSEALSSLALSTLSAYQNQAAVKWNDAELAVYLVFMFGEINKSGAKGRAAFCNTPSVVAREQRKTTDYSEYPLTKHGEMLYALVQSGISSYPNKTVVMQFFESAARYGDFFKVRKECIMPTLAAMVDARGLHSPDTGIQKRAFYLFHRFIKEDRNEISSELAGNLIERLRDLLSIKVELPEVEDGEQVDMLMEAVNTPGLFEAQLYLFESMGTLISLYWKSPEHSSALLLSVIEPLLEELSQSLQVVKGPEDIIPILKIHHIIMALGNIAKGFPDYPSPLPEGYILPPMDVFSRIAHAIIVSLGAMNVFRIVRDATRFAFARILATTGPNVTSLIPPLMSNLLAHFETTELIDFMNFIGLLMHKLQQDLAEVLDELIGPLNTYIAGLLSQPVSGTDDQVTHMDTKRAYLNLLNNIMSSKLHDVLISERNKGQLESLLTSMQRLIEDFSDPTSQKAAFQFLGRCITTWACSPSSVAQNGDAHPPSEILPWLERFLYDQLIPSTFAILSSPQFNLKDGQMLVVLQEICNFLQAISKARGQESLDFLVNRFLPAQNWPQEAALEFTAKLRDLDNKSFKRYLQDFVRASRAGS